MCDCGAGEGHPSEMVAATGCGPHLRAARDASQSFVHLPLLTELRHVAKGVRLILNPSSLLIQGYTAVAVWSCAPSRLKLSWSVAFNFLVFGVIFPLTHGITESECPWAENGSAFPLQHA